MPSQEVDYSSPRRRRRRHRRRCPVTSTFTTCCCCSIAVVLLLSLVPAQAATGASMTAQQQTPSSHADITQKEFDEDESSDPLVETSLEVDEEENSITSQESSDEAPEKYVAHHIDGYGSITSCNDVQTSSAGRDTEGIEGTSQQHNYETVDLEIKFDYQMELISLVSDEDIVDAYHELIALTERTMHQMMVDNFLDCGSSGATEAHGMDRRRQLADVVVESMSPNPQIVGISSAPQDAISLTGSCASVHTTEDACVVVDAAATVTVEMDGITNAELLSKAIDTIRSSILEKIATDMKQGQYDERYGRNIFAKLSFLDPNPVDGDVARPLVASSSLPENEIGNDAHDPSVPTATSLRGESHVRYRRRNVRAIVVVIGMLTIALAFKLIFYNRDLRSNRRDSNVKKSWRNRSDDTDDGTAEDTDAKRKKKESKMPKYESFGNTGSDGSASIIVEEEEEGEIDESQSDDFEENENPESIGTGSNEDDDDWTYDAIGRQESLEVLDLESGTDAAATEEYCQMMESSARIKSNLKGRGALQMAANGEVRQINAFDEAWDTFWLRG